MGEETRFWIVQVYAKQIHCDWLLFTKRGGVNIVHSIVHLFIFFSSCKNSYCYGSYRLVSVCRHFLT